jgi:hypothetical protein
MKEEHTLQHAVLGVDAAAKLIAAVEGNERVQREHAAVEGVCAHDRVGLPIGREDKGAKVREAVEKV